MKLRAYIVDDEPPAIGTLVSLLNKHEDEFSIEIVGTSTKPEEALEQIEELKPNLLFLDVEMPNYSGFELMAEITYDDLLVVFVTAYRDYAAHAFDVNAFHYIVKPVSPVKFQNCLSKVYDHISDKKFNKKENVIAYNEKATNKLALRGTEDYTILNCEDILYVSSDGAYSNFYLSQGNKMTHTKSLKYCVDLLPQNSFQRISRSCIVNLSFIESFSLKAGGSVTMTNQKTFLVGRSYRSQAIERIKSHFGL